MQASKSTTTRLDESVLCAWREGMAEAARNPRLKEQFLDREEALLPCFAERYEKLKALPRRMRRTLQRIWKRSLVGLALLLALGQAPALAATINVGGGCLLVNAITAANTNNAIGLCKAGSGARTLLYCPRTAHRR